MKKIFIFVFVGIWVFVSGVVIALDSELIGLNNYFESGESVAPSETYTISMSNNCEKGCEIGTVISVSGTVIDSETNKSVTVIVNYDIYVHNSNGTSMWDPLGSDATDNKGKFSNTIEPWTGFVWKKYWPAGTYTIHVDTIWGSGTNDFILNKKKVKPEEKSAESGLE